jgi:glycerophosphoryl diester phosphodiesterase
MSELPPDWERRAQAVQAVAIHVNQRHLTAGQASAVKDAGFGLFCYTVNDPARARELLGWGVDAFCTDRIDLIGPDFAGSVRHG